MFSLPPAGAGGGRSEATGRSFASWSNRPFRCPGQVTWRNARVVSSCWIIAANSSAL